MPIGQIAWNKGKKGLVKMSEETKQKMSEAHKGISTWNKGLKGAFKHTKESKEKLRLAHLGKVKLYARVPHTEKWKKQMSLLKKGKPVPWATGEKHHLWKGGITPSNTKARKGKKYKEWLKQVMKKDNYVCQSCERQGVYLHAHHIYAFSDYPEYRFEVWNGQTLCKECHEDLHKQFGK